MASRTQRRHDGRRLLRLAAGLQAVVLVAAARPVLGDGGVVRARATSGPFTITLFTSPSPLRAGEVDVSVLVQEAKSGSTVLDADVVLEVDADGPAPAPARAGGAAVGMAEAGAGTAPLGTQLTRARATNQLLYAGRVLLERPGRFRFRVAVRRGAARGVVSATAEAAPALPRALALWPYLALPPVAIVLFLVHQWLRRRSRSRTVRARDALAAGRS